MSSSLTPKQVAEQALKEKAELEARVKYLQSQLGQLVYMKQRNQRSSGSLSKHKDSDEFEGSNPMEDSSEEDYGRHPRKHHRPKDRSFNYFKVGIPEFEGQLDPDLLLDWL